MDPSSCRGSRSARGWAAIATGTRSSPPRSPRRRLNDLRGRALALLEAAPLDARAQPEPVGAPAAAPEAVHAAPARAARAARRHRRTRDAAEPAGALAPVREHADRAPADRAAANGAPAAARAVDLPHARELQDDLRALDASLRAIGAARVAATEVHPIIRLVQTFGFHLASVDVRQNSAFHARALVQLARRRPRHRPVRRLAEDERLAFLERELMSPRPFAPSRCARRGRGRRRARVLPRAAHAPRAAFGRDGSAAHRQHDPRRLRPAGRLPARTRERAARRRRPAGPACALPVVPLFETIEDLHASAGIFERFLSHPITRRTLARLRTPASGRRRR
jgi:phosphoenolpyruvate carboxylase